MSAHLCSAHIGHGTPSALSAWCPITNLIAIVSRGSSSGSSIGSSSVAGSKDVPGRVQAARDGAEKDPKSVQRPSIVLLEPGCCEEYFTLELPESAGNDAVASISWTPPGTKRALLVAMAKGPSYIWMQEPNDDSHADAALLPSINCWYANQLGDADGQIPAPDPPAPLPQPALPPKAPDDDMPDFFTQDNDPPRPPAADPNTAAPKPSPADPGAASASSENKVVYAGWLSPPPVLHWNAERLAQQQPSESVFQADASVQLPAASWSSVQHWVRPSLLAAAFVRESAQVTFWWATMSTRSMSRLSWRSAQPIQLMQNVSVRLAHACAALENAVRVALVTAEDPHAVQLFEVTGTLTLPHISNAPAPHQISTAHIAVLRLPEDAGPALPPPDLFSITLLPSSFGRALVTASAAVPSQDHGLSAGLDPGFMPGFSSRPSPGSSCLHLYRQSQSQSPWELVASYQASGTTEDDGSDGFALGVASGGGASSAGPAAAAACGAGCVAVSEDGSKLVLLAGGLLHVVDGTHLRRLALRDLTGAEVTAAPAPGSGAADGDATASATLCISPNSCCVAVAVAAAAQPLPAPGHGSAAPAEWGGDCQGGPVATPPPLWAAQPPSQAQGTMLHVMSLPEIPGAPPPPGAAETPELAAWRALAARLDAMRLLHAALSGRQPWDIVGRVVQLAAATEQSSAVATLDTLDLVFMGFEDFPRPSYSMALDRVKLALLRRLPGRHAAVVGADLAARMVLKQRHHVLLVLNNNSDAAAAADRAARQEDLVAVQPWLAWGHDYLVLLLASVKRYQQQPTAAADGGGGGGPAVMDDALPGLRLLQDATAMQKLGSLLVGWVSWSRQVSKARSADARAISEPEALIRGFLSVFNAKENAGVREPAEQHPGGIGRGVFSGPYHLHVARPSRNCTTAEKIKAVLQPGMAHLVPDLSADELMMRARELGIAGRGPEAQEPARLVMAKVATSGAWERWRGTREKPGAAAQAQQAAALRQRWRQQRARAVLPMGSAAASGSRAAAAAALETFPLLDALSGKRLPWETAALSYECVDAVFATAELALDGGDDGDGGAEAGAGAGALRDGQGRAAAGHAMLRKSWLRSFTPAGTMWKRIKVKHSPSQAADR